MTAVLHLLPHRGGGAETYIDMLESLDGYDHRRLALSATRSPLLAPPSIAVRFARIAKAARAADLVHVHGDAAALLALPLLALGPATWTTHGLHLLRRSAGVQRRALDRGLAAVVRHSAVTICTSTEEADELGALLSPEATRRLLVVSNGVAMPPAADPAERAETRRLLGLGEGTCAVLFLGQLEDRKDPLTAARAALTAREHGSDVVLLVAGEGPLEAELRRLEGSAVKVLGFRNDTERLFDAADVFVLPSAREGLSFALLEAMSHALPPVVSDGAGNTEVVGDAGRVFPFANAPALAEALGELARGADERRRLGERARARVEANYGADDFRQGVARAYGIALARG